MYLCSWMDISLGMCAAKPHEAPWLRLRLGPLSAQIAGVLLIETHRRWQRHTDAWSAMRHVKKGFRTRRGSGGGRRDIRVA